ncbi:unnamed protein product [Cylicostephanus goldi]|uniref:C-type lectin domain-containing protein n=1 Tax=Cylicostephanus goldi TaxID=71465 RepID=A0A3P6S952_CYLGO|nr:unnamed protein product [Cylicostephanus goldi]
MAEITHDLVNLFIILISFCRKNSENPTFAANTFKDFGGILVTVEYLQEGGIPVPILTKIASEGYSTANCFCPDNYVPYNNSRPEYGCYRAARMPAERSGAERSCGLEHNGKLAKVENYEKAKFLMTMKTALKSEALIGLKRCCGGHYHWPDNTMVRHLFLKRQKGRNAYDTVLVQSTACIIALIVSKKRRNQLRQGIIEKSLRAQRNV